MVDPPVTFIAGGRGAIARATAVRLARRGDRLVLADASEYSLSRIDEAVRAVGGIGETHILQPRDRATLEKVSLDVVERLGGITYLYCDGGDARDGAIADLALADWLAIIETQLTMSFHWCQVVIPHMIRRQGGAVLLRSSDAAVVGSATRASCAADTALYALTKALALEFAAHGVRVNAIGPGLIEPGASDGVPASESNLVAGPTASSSGPMDRAGNPEEVASVTEFLLSDRASYITGQLVQPNGGRVMW